MPISETARVLRVKKDVAYVEIAKKEQCGGCKVCAFGKKDKLTVPAYCGEKCAAGDSVIVEMPEKTIKSAPVIMYILPLIAFFFGLLAGSVTKNELIMFGLAVAFLAAGFLGVFLLDKLFYKKKSVMPTVVRVLENNITEREVNDSINEK